MTFDPQLDLLAERARVACEELAAYAKARTGTTYGAGYRFAGRCMAQALYWIAFLLPRDAPDAAPRVADAPRREWRRDDRRRDVPPRPPCSARTALGYPCKRPAFAGGLCRKHLNS